MAPVLKKTRTVISSSSSDEEDIIVRKRKLRDQTPDSESNDVPTQRYELRSAERKRRGAVIESSSSSSESDDDDDEEGESEDDSVIEEMVSDSEDAEDLPERKMASNEFLEGLEPETLLSRVTMRVFKIKEISTNYSAGHRTYLTTVVLKNDNGTTVELLGWDDLGKELQKLIKFRTYTFCDIVVQSDRGYNQCNAQYQFKFTSKSRYEKCKIN
ncbi:hypothetical protein DdX_17571 [Ditylenchus destructor]|uniref:Uncharacterized protein n=1 Tax=Ditylenchus destructor TaxID=166010 RepID=A0AAD4QZ21_9BILA|nr:hypothetical protein DdX_17571 [Ditylenchus destructor]